jgi:hypothetical protein
VACKADMYRGLDILSVQKFSLFRVVVLLLLQWGQMWTRPTTADAGGVGGGTRLLYVLESEGLE